jgi:GNAT superfamily N-acetyltransferase
VIRAGRVADAPAIARVHVDSARVAYRGLVPRAHLDRMSYADRESSWRPMLANEGMVTFVADEPRAGVVGFANGGACLADGLPSDGELYAIYVLASHWGRGLGAQLLRAVAGALAERGFSAMGLWVLRDNPACRFYESLGGTRAGGGETFMGGACLPKVAFVWPRLPIG